MIRRKRYWKVVQTGGLLLMNNDETLGIAQRLLKDSYFKDIEETEEEVINFLEQKRFPEKFAQKVLQFAEVNEEVKG